MRRTVLNKLLVLGTLLGITENLKGLVDLDHHFLGSLSRVAIGVTKSQKRKFRSVLSFKCLMLGDVISRTIPWRPYGKPS